MYITPCISLQGNLTRCKLDTAFIASMRASSCMTWHKKPVVSSILYVVVLTVHCVLHFASSSKILNDYGWMQILQALIGSSSCGLDCPFPLQPTLFNQAPSIMHRKVWNLIIWPSKILLRQRSTSKDEATWTCYLPRMSVFLESDKENRLPCRKEALVRMAPDRQWQFLVSTPRFLM